MIRKKTDKRKILRKFSAEYSLTRTQVKYIGSDKSVLRGDTDPDTPRLREMIRNFYDELEFPNDREHFADLAIYVRRVGFPSS